jgi:outer membrane protein
MKNILCLLLFFPVLLPAQEVLTLDEAIQQALNNNPNIRIARYNFETVENQAEPGLAGLLPRVDFSGGATYSNSNGGATFPITDSVTGLPTIDPGTGEEVTRKVTANGIQTYGFNAALGLNYTVFSSGANRNNYRVLQNNVELTKSQVRSQIEGTLIQVINAYYQLTRLVANYQTLRESMEASRDRLEFVKNQFEFGQGSSLAVLNAEVDLNTDSVNLATADLNIENARRELNLLMGKPLTEAYEVDQEVAWQNNWRIDELVSLARQGNADLQAAAYNRKISELNLRISQAARLPKLDVNASYGYNFNNLGPFGFVRTTNGLGLNAGATLSVPIFTGFQNQINIQNSEIAVASSNLGYKQAEQQLLKELNNALATYRNNLRIYDLQQKSLAAAQANFERTQEAFELGQTNSLQFREAQLNLQRVRNQINDLRYDIKLSEIELMRLSGQLVQE